MPSNANLCSRSCSWNHKRQTALRTVCACLSVDYGCFQCKKKLNRKSLVGILVWSLVWLRCLVYGQKAKGIQRKWKNRHNECKAQKIRDGSNEFRMWIREIPFRIFERWFWRWLALVRWRSEWRKKKCRKSYTISLTLMANRRQKICGENFLSTFLKICSIAAALRCGDVGTEKKSK